jgi:hypothetical protein
MRGNQNGSFAPQSTERVHVRGHPCGTQTGRGGAPINEI